MPKQHLGQGQALQGPSIRQGLQGRDARARFLAGLRTDGIDQDAGIEAYR
jgi:hypothetical protein